MRRRRRELQPFGQPAWQAGRRTFCTVSRYDRRPEIHGWVGADQQATYPFDDRYRIPPYTEHNGWIALDLEDEILWDAVTGLVLNSYRHLALERMLRALDGWAGLAGRLPSGTTGSTRSRWLTAGPHRWSSLLNSRGPRTTYFLNQCVLEVRPQRPPRRPVEQSWRGGSVEEPAE